MVGVSVAKILCRLAWRPWRGGLKRVRAWHPVKRAKRLRAFHRKVKSGATLAARSAQP